jgi:NAD(P)-dependent dehydrogenase (short-subunit alcohol dehydrogenase family)
VSEGALVVVGGTAGLGKELARWYADRGGDVVVGGRSVERASAVAEELGPQVRGAAVDLAAPETIAAALEDVGAVDRLVLAAIERDANSVREYDIAQATRLATLKLVGYMEVVHTLLDRLGDDSSILLFGGLAKDRPYPGSTTVTSVNGAVSTMVNTLVIELAPIRVNALHPGIVGDSPQWENKDEMLDRVRARTPTGRLVTMADVTSAAVFLLENRSVNGINLRVDGGTLLL